MYSTCTVYSTIQPTLYMYNHVHVWPFTMCVCVCHNNVLHTHEVYTYTCTCTLCREVLHSYTLYMYNVTLVVDKVTDVRSQRVRGRETLITCHEVCYSTVSHCPHNTHTVRGQTMSQPVQPPSQDSNDVTTIHVRVSPISFTSSFI